MSGPLLNSWSLILFPMPHESTVQHAFISAWELLKQGKNNYIHVTTWNKNLLVPIHLQSRVILHTGGRRNEIRNAREALTAREHLACRGNSAICNVAVFTISWWTAQILYSYEIGINPWNHPHLKFSLFKEIVSNSTSIQSIRHTAWFKSELFLWTLLAYNEEICSQLLIIVEQELNKSWKKL